MSTDAYDAGDITPTEAARGLLAALRDIEAALAPLEQQRKDIRAGLERICARMDGQRGAFEGLGEIAITAGGEAASYDARALDSLSAELLATGDAEYVRIAARIAQARKVTSRAASLRVTAWKPRA